MLWHFLVYNKEAFHFKISDQKAFIIIVRQTKINSFSEFKLQ